LLDSNRVWGPDHPITISFLFNRGYCAVQAGELSEASSDYLEALRRVRETFSPSHPLTIFIEGYWADLLRLQGDPAKASLILARVLQMQIELFGKDHPDTLQTLYYLAHARKEQGLLQEGLELAKDLLERTPDEQWEFTQRETLMLSIEDALPKK
jgi:tetratricopeptide (TPR) repeat protein